MARLERSRRPSVFPLDAATGSAFVLCLFMIIVNKNLINPGQFGRWGGLLVSRTRVKTGQGIIRFWREIFVLFQRLGLLTKANIFE
jgi:hypothetical protein